VSELSLELYENTVMTFAIKKRINTELFIDKTAVIYKVDGHIKCNEGGQP